MPLDKRWSGLGTIGVAKAFIRWTERLY